MSNDEPVEDEVLLAYAIEPSHDLATLERYLQRYPQFTTGLIECSIEQEQSPIPVEAPEVVTSAFAAAWDRFQKAMGNETSRAMDPFALLERKAFHALATELHMNALLLIRLRDRAIRFATIPRPLIRMLAEKLNVGLDRMEGYLRGSPVLDPGRLQFKSATKPATEPQIDFADAVRISQLTDEQQRHLLTLSD